MNRNITISDVSCIKTAPAKIRLLIVKITASNDMVGYGCATFTQRPHCVAVAVEKYLKHLVKGRNVFETEDIWLACKLSSYWRNGPVLNNAISGIDQALWDLKGKILGVPVTDLLGGLCRKHAPVYVHASGETIEETISSAKSFIEDGFKYVRLQCATPGKSTSTYGAGEGGDYVGSGKTKSKEINSPTNPQTYFDPKEYKRQTVKLFKAAREELGDEIELLHDAHERLEPSDAIDLAKDLEPYKLFFLEDALPPEQSHYFSDIKRHSTTPIAMGELFTNEAEYLPLIIKREIDFIRVHMSDIGGITPCIKLAHLCNYFGVRLALHGPGDTSPIGMAANMAINLTNKNFGIQEWHIDHLGVTGKYHKEMNSVFKDMIKIKDGAALPNSKPGLGIEVDESDAEKYPWPSDPRDGANPSLWEPVRDPNGAIIYP
jgi:mannonate dehydratase